MLIKRIDEFTNPGLPCKSITTFDYEYDFNKRLVRITYTSVSENIIRLADMWVTAATCNGDERLPAVRQVLRRKNDATKNICRYKKYFLNLNTGLQ